MAWHPHCIKLAVATRDDVVLVYTGSTPTPVVVRHSSQRDVSSLAWRLVSSGLQLKIPFIILYILYSLMNITNATCMCM